MNETEGRRMKWNMIKSRPMNEEERKECYEKLGYEISDEEAVVFTSTPDDGQSVLVCDKYGHVAIDTFMNDPEYGCCFEDNGINSIIAWMPLPEPPKEEEE